MRVSIHGDLHAGQLSIPIRSLLTHCPTLFVNSNPGDQLLFVTLEGSREDLEERLEALIKPSRLRVELQRVGEAVLVPTMGTSPVMHGLGVRLNELYVVPFDWSGAADGLKTFLPDHTSFENGTPPEFIETFRRIGAVRFFADGLGTNFCVSSMQDAHDIENAEQTGGVKRF